MSSRSSRVAATLARLLDPMRLVAAHRRLLFRLGAECGERVLVTHRAELFNHTGERARCRIGAHALIDGTLEIYERGHLTIGRHTFIGRSRVYAAVRVAIGDFCLVSDRVAIMDSDTHPMRAAAREREALRWAEGKMLDVYDGVKSGEVRLEARSWIGYGAVIGKGVTVGEGCIVGAGSVVTKSVPPWTIVAGNPARVIRELRPEER
jgi:acetyltransferase-like isoleucine patch superfamily enzyme